MSYKLFSAKTSTDHSVMQWEGRSLEGELESFKDRTLVRLFKTYLGNSRAKILEGGCGFGAWCEWFQQQNHEIIGVEHDQNIINRAKEFKEDIAIEYGDITNLKHADNSFDAYISLGVIEHFEHGPEEALSEAFRILKPSGLAFISTPLLTPYRRFFSHPIRDIYFLKRKLSGKPSYFWEYRFTKYELSNYIEQAGFEIIQTGIDDYESYVKNRHIGLWLDWFFLRQPGGEIWELNKPGQTILKIIKLFPAYWSCSGLILVARANKEDK